MKQVTMEAIRIMARDVVKVLAVATLVLAGYVGVCAVAMVADFNILVDSVSNFWSEGLMFGVCAVIFGVIGTAVILIVKAMAKAWYRSAVKRAEKCFARPLVEG